MRPMKIHVKEVAQPISLLALFGTDNALEYRVILPIGLKLLVDNTKCSHLASWKQDAYRRIGGGNSVSRLFPLANDTLHG